MLFSVEPTGTAFSSSHDFEMKENSLNAAELAAFAPLRTFYNKNSMPVAPYAMANVIGNIPPAESPFRPIQQSPGPQQQHLSSDEYSRNENTASNRVCKLSAINCYNYLYFLIFSHDILGFLCIYAFNVTD